MDLDCRRGAVNLWLAKQRYLPVGSGGSNAQVWQMPVCARYGTPAGEQRACMLLKSEIGLLPLGKACPLWVAPESPRYFRAAYAGKTTGTSVSRRTSIADAVTAVGEIDALARNGSLSLAAALERLQSYAAYRNRDVAQSLIWTLGDLRPIIAEELRPQWERFAGKLFGRQARELGFAPGPRDSDDTLRLRPALIEFLAAEGNDPALHSQATQLALRWLGDRRAMDGTMAETVLQAAARRGDRELFERLRAAALDTSDRRDRRIIYVALGSFRDPGIARSALALILDPAHDYREAIQIAWGQPGTPQGSARTFEFMKTNFDALVARAPRDAAAWYPRMMGGFCSNADRAELENFFRDRASKYAGGPRILAQTLERISLCTAFKQKQGASLAEFLRRY